MSTVFSFGFTLLGGAIVGLLTALGARRISAVIDDKIAETVLTISAVYGSYVFATGLGVSGLVAVAVIGLFFGNVTMSSTMRPDTRETILTFWRIAAFLGYSVAFLLIGFQIDIVAISQSVLLILVAYLAVTIARATSVYPILGIFSQVGEGIPIRWSHIAMLGGVRGALSIALAASLSTSAVVSDADIHIITTMVVGVAFLSIAIQAPILSRYIKRRFGD